MNSRDRKILSEYLESRRQMKSAWDTLHRQAYRQTFIHCRLALNHLVRAAILLEGGDTGGREPLHTFFALLGREIPLGKAEGFTMVLHPPELKSLGPVNRDNLSESVSDWLVTRKISRQRAFEHLNLAQETINICIKIIEKKHPGFFRQMDR